MKHAMGMSIDALRCFEAAARQLSFAKAAARVALSPTAFSSRIKQLEEALGERLFERTTRRVALTGAGRRLLPHAERILMDLDRCREIVHGESAPAPFALTLGTRFELGLSWIVPALDALAAARPGRKLHLVFGDGKELLRQAINGDIDCTVSSLRLTTSGIRYVVLHEETYAFVAAPRLLRQHPLDDRAEAAQHVLLDLHAELPLFRYFLDAQGPASVWRFAAHEWLGTIAAVRERVLTGAGVAVLPRYFIRDDLAKKRLVNVFPKARLTRDYFRLIWRERHPLEREIEQLGSELKRKPLR